MKIPGCCGTSTAWIILLYLNKLSKCINQYINILGKPPYFILISNIQFNMKFFNEVSSYFIKTFCKERKFKSAMNVSGSV